MKILVTGGAGFIASHIVDEYLKAGHEVVALDNMRTGKRENLNPRAKFMGADIRDDLDTLFSVEKFDVVNHHAAQISVRESVLDPVLDAEINIIGLLNLLELAKKYNVKKVLFSSSAAVYGDNPNLPYVEDMGLEPMSPYGVSKATSEYYLKYYSVLFGLKYTIFRYSNVYGPRQDPKGEAGVVSIFCDAMKAGEETNIYGSGDQTRDYIYVKDIAFANLLGLAKGDNEVINISTNSEISVNDLHKTVNKTLNKNLVPNYLDPKKGDPFRSRLDNEKALTVLGWKPKIQLEEGLSLTLS